MKAIGRLARALVLVVSSMVLFSVSPAVSADEVHDCWENAASPCKDWDCYHLADSTWVYQYTIDNVNCTTCGYEWAWKTFPCGHAPCNGQTIHVYLNWPKPC